MSGQSSFKGEVSHNTPQLIQNEKKAPVFRFPENPPTHSNNK